MTAAPPGVELWLIDVAAAGPALAALEEAVPRLSDDERRRARALSRGGEDWRLIRIALRLLLERYVGPELRAVPFSMTSRGKPLLPWDAGVSFSLSHSGRYGLIALAPSDVGVDIEDDRRVRFPSDRQAAIVAAACALALASLNGHMEGDHFPIQAWVRLEAWSKARGSGIGALLHDLGIRGPEWQASGGKIDFGRRAIELLQREGFILHDLSIPLPVHSAVAARPGTALLPVRHLPTDQESLMGLISAA